MQLIQGAWPPQRLGDVLFDRGALEAVVVVGGLFGAREIVSGGASILPVLVYPPSPTHQP